MMFWFILLSTTYAIVESNVIELNDKNCHFVQTGEWFIKAYAPSCRASISIASPWIKLGEWALDKPYNIAEIDITAGHSFGNQLLVTKTPTLLHVKDGVFTHFQGIINSNQYRGKLETWKTFLQEKMSEKLEPLSWYKCPGSVTMTLYAYFTIDCKILGIVVSSSLMLALIILSIKLISVSVRLVKTKKS